MICKLTDVADISADTWYEFSLQTDNVLLSVMLYQNNGELIAFKNSCPHQGRRMDYMAGKFLLAQNGNIVCPAHGAEFNAQTGLCINGPCLGQSLESIKVSSDEKSIFAVIK